MVEFKFPDVGEGIVEGTILRWLVKVGDLVQVHQSLVEVETDKAVVELPAPCAGVIKELRGAEGEMVAVGVVLAVIDEKSDQAEVEAAPQERSRALGVVGELEEAPEETSKQPVLAATAQRPRLLPRDRRLAKELDVDLASLPGNGPQGRITEQDIRAAAGGVATTSPAERLPLKGVRKAMAKAMAASVRSAVHVTIMERADAQALREIKERERTLAAKQGLHLTYLPFIVKALTLVLERFPLLNSTFDEAAEEIVLHREINLGFAVDTPEGLLVPVVHGARRKSILELAAVLGELARRARERQITPAELKGGTFTVSNYGALGGLWGTPIINPPEAAILGVGRIEDAAVVRDGRVTVRPIVPLSLTFDHRIIDGATAQKFLNSLIEHIENPDLVLLET